MSNYLAVATVTETLRHLVLQAVRGIPGTDVTTERPERGAGGDEARPRVNVFLYMAMPNPSLRNADLPMRNGEGQLANRPVAPLDLYYLVTFYGSTKQQVAQQLMALTALALHERAVLTRCDVLEAIASAPEGYLNDSDLPDQPQRVYLSPLPHTLEELSRLWSILFQVPYNLSMALQASVVLLDGPPAAQALPVRQPPSISAAPGRAPALLSVAAARAGEPIVACCSVEVRGVALEGVEIRVDGVPAPVDERSATRLVVRLEGPHLRAGRMEMRAHRGEVASGELPFILAPLVRAAAVVPAAKGGRRGRGSWAVQVDVSPWVPETAQVTLLLDADDGSGRRYAFDAPEVLPVPAHPLRRGRFTIPVPGVAPGRYRVRVQAGGAVSPVSATRLPECGGAIDAPTVVLP
jgi:hypothetical protein